MAIIIFLRLNAALIWMQQRIVLTTILLFSSLTNRINFFWIWLYQGWGLFEGSVYQLFCPKCGAYPGVALSWGWRHNIQVNMVYLLADNWLIYMHWFKKLTVIGFSRWEIVSVMKKYRYLIDFSLFTSKMLMHQQIPDLKTTVYIAL